MITRMSRHAVPGGARHTTPPRRTRARRTAMRRLLGTFVAAALAAGALGAGADPATAVVPGPAPGTVDAVVRDLQSWQRSFGRTEEQQADPAYDGSVEAEVGRLQGVWANEDFTEFAGRPRLTLTRWLLTRLFVGDPWRNETRWSGQHRTLYFLNRWGAKLSADLWGPADTFTNPVRRPGIVITTGSIQGNARMYFWAAQALASAGYVVLTYDVQGQGESETFGHRADGSLDCDKPVQPADTPPFLREIGSCPGVPFQQPANFGGGAIDAHNFFVSTPQAPYANFRPGTGTEVANPWANVLDTSRVGAAGHSLGAAAVSFVQANQNLLTSPIRAVVAWDALSECSARASSAGGPPTGACLPGAQNTPTVPALSLTNDFFVPIAPAAATVSSPTAKLAAFDAWRAAGVPTATIVLGGGSHLEYTSTPAVPFVLGATKYGQDIATHYTVAWFDRYVKGDPTAAARLTARTFAFTHVNPLGVADAQPTDVDIASFSSWYANSAIDVDGTCSRDWAIGTRC